MVGRAVESLTGREGKGMKRTLTVDEYAKANDLVTHIGNNWRGQGNKFAVLENARELVSVLRSVVEPTLGNNSTGCQHVYTDGSGESCPYMQEVEIDGYSFCYVHGCRELARIAGIAIVIADTSPDVED